MNALKLRKNPPKLKRSTQDCIPVKAVFKNGMFLEEDGIWSKAYSFEDIAFTLKPEEEQESIMDKFGAFLNAIPTEVYIKVCAYTHKADVRNLIKNLSVAPNNQYDEYRRGYNELLEEVIYKKTVQTDKYIILCVKMNDQKKADLLLDTADRALNELMINLGTRAELLTAEERLELLQQILNNSEKNPVFVHEGDITKLPWKDLSRQGLNFKDIIVPQYLSFLGSYFEINDYFGQSMYLQTMPSKLSTNFYRELSSLSFEGLTTYFIYPKNPSDVAKILKNADIGIKTEFSDSENLDRSSYSMADEIDAWATDIQDRDQKMFEFDLCVCHFADDLEALKADAQEIKSIADKHGCSINKAIVKQERYFYTALPLATIPVSKSRYITTEALGLFQFFDSINTAQKGGQYYGINQYNGNLIVLNKKQGKNYNSMILGSSGSGKTVSAKLEITGAILNSNDPIFIIDPEGEYCKLVEAFGGTVISVLPISKFNQTASATYINACDLDIDTSADRETDPTAMKIDFLCGLVETMMGGREVLNSAQLSILQKCITQIYESYIKHLMELNDAGIKVTIDRQSCPTLGTLADALLNSGDPEGQRIAQRIQPYVSGIYSIFAHATNVEVNNRIVCFNLKGCSDTMLNVALKVCLNDVWNRTIENRKKNTMTRVYFDEAHAFLKNPTSAAYFEKFWRRFRKWGGMPTAITQKVSDLLNSVVASTLLSESSTTLILGQEEAERMLIQEAYGLHDTEIKYLRNAEVGSGIIINAGCVIPIRNRIPKNNVLYPLFSTTIER